MSFLFQKLLTNSCNLQDFSEFQYIPLLSFSQRWITEIHSIFNITAAIQKQPITKTQNIQDQYNFSAVLKRNEVWVFSKEEAGRKQTTAFREFPQFHQKLEKFEHRDFKQQLLRKIKLFLHLNTTLPECCPGRRSLDMWWEQRITIMKCFTESKLLSEAETDINM